jgi:hypothetical protein
MMKSAKSTITLPPPTTSAKDQLTPFLKPQGIAEKGITKLTLLGAARQSNSRFGKGIDVACKIGNKEYTWTVKFESGNYRRLFGRFSRDVKKWKGIVKVERKEYLGREYVAVVD